jgi:hypothetical protein
MFTVLESSENSEHLCTGHPNTGTFQKLDILCPVFRLWSPFEYRSGLRMAIAI